MKRQAIYVVPYLALDDIFNLIIISSESSYKGVVIFFFRSFISIENVYSVYNPTPAWDDIIIDIKIIEDRVII